MNIVIYSEDILYCKQLINELNKTNFNIKVCCIFNNINEFNQIYNWNKIDFFILYENKNSNLAIFNNILNSIPHNSIIIINDSNTNLINKNITCIRRNKNLLCDINNLNNIIDKNENDIKLKLKIKHELNLLGFNSLYIGTRYILEAIYLLYNMDSNNVILEKDIYPIIAKMHNKSINNIKCNIINATNNMYYDCNEKFLENYTMSPFKPSPKKIMLIIIYKLKIHQNII